jgi:hypothetical protein
MTCSHCGEELVPPLFCIMSAPNDYYTREFMVHRECLVSLTDQITVRRLETGLTKSGWVQMTLPLECQQGHSNQAR